MVRFNQNSNFKPAKIEHAGLWFDKYLCSSNDNDEGTQQKQAHVQSVAALAEPPLYKVFYEEWRNLYESKFKGKFAATQMTKEELTPQISKVDSLLKRYPLASKELERKLRDLEDNYYFTIEDIYPQVVYEGYPIKTRKHTSLLALDFLHSYEKMGVYPEEYVALYLLVDKMKEKYSEQFVLAKYLFIAGY